MCGVIAGLMINRECLTGVLSFRGKRACADPGTCRGSGGFRCAAPTGQRDAELPAAEQPVNRRLPGGPAPRRACACPGYGSGSCASSVICARIRPSGKQRFRACSPKQHGENSILKETFCQIAARASCCSQGPRAAHKINGATFSLSLNPAFQLPCPDGNRDCSMHMCIISTLPAYDSHAACAGTGSGPLHGAWSGAGACAVQRPSDQPVSGPRRRRPQQSDGAGRRGCSRGPRRQAAHL